MLTNASELILRNREEFNQLDLLLVNCEADSLPIELGKTAQSITLFNQDFRVHHYQKNHLKESQFYFAASYESAKKHDAAVIFYPKAKPLADFLIANISQHVKADGLLFLVGENNGGIKSAAKRLKQQSIIAQKLDAARHCNLLCWQNQTPATFDLADNFHSYHYQHLTIKALPGVFSQTELDAGTALLLNNLPKHIKGTVLDFACGSGVIGASVAAQFSNTTIDLIDVSALAIESSKQTLLANQLKGQVFASDGLSAVSEKYDWILTNPPFHTGIKTDYAITQNFLAAVKNNLKPRGKLLLVANNFLPYLPLLNEQFQNVETIAHDNKFSVYLAG